MILLPAIDLLEGEVVRLKQGKKDQKTVYSQDPAKIAREWVAVGGDWIHIVDLDAAFTGSHQNLDKVREIVNAVSVPCQMGGGMRSVEAIEKALAAGVSRVVIGTRATESIDFVRDACKRFGSEKIVVGIDAKGGKVAVRGWTEGTGIDALDLALAVEDAGAGAIVYTDVATDGMLQGPNLGELDRLLERLNVSLIASGGVSGPRDLDALAARANLYGTIVGKALYEGRFPDGLGAW